MNAKTRRHAPIALLILASALALTACASTTTTTVRTPASTPAAAAPSTPALAAAPSATPSASEVLCTSHSCIVSDLERGLTGLVAQDDAVSTKVTCYESTVVYYKAADTYSASCTVDYSDGSSASGTGNFIVASSKVTFDPSD